MEDDATDGDGAAASMGLRASSKLRFRGRKQHAYEMGSAAAIVRRHSGLRAADRGSPGVLGAVGSHGPTYAGASR